MIFHILIDDREHHIRTQLGITNENKEVTYKDILIKQSHLSLGDFVIMCDENVIALIERKTIADYAASIKDGRHKNKLKILLAANNSSIAANEESISANVDIFYIIEGDLYNGEIINGIPQTTIISSVTNLMTRDKIFVINTANIESTINRLIELVNSYKKHYGETKGGVELDHFKEIQYKKNTPEIVQDILLSIPFITIKNIRRFYTYSIHELCILEELVLHKKTKDFLNDCKHKESKSFQRLLNKIPRISLKKAKEISTQCSILDLDLLPQNIKEILTYKLPAIIY